MASARRNETLDVSLTYLYSDGDFYMFMHPDSFEQYRAKAAVVKDIAKWLLENTV